MTKSLHDVEGLDLKVNPSEKTNSFDERERLCEFRENYFRSGTRFRVELTIEKSFRGLPITIRKKKVQEFRKVSKVHLGSRRNPKTLQNIGYNFTS